MRKDIGIWLHMNTFDPNAYDQINDVRIEVHEAIARIDLLEREVSLLRQDIDLLRSVCEIMNGALYAVKRALDELGIPSIDDLI